VNKTAFITGIGGQDGAYLAEFLLSKGYRVTGILRRHAVSETQDWHLKHEQHRIESMYGDLTDVSSLHLALKKYQPDEIYNLGAMSHVRVSFDVPEYTADVNAIGTLNLLQAMQAECPQARFYQASSSEQFGLGVDEDGFQRETTRMDPVSPYGCAKLFAYTMVRHWRRAFGAFACNGILFNHCSKRRGSNFVEAKIVKEALKIKHGLADRIVLGNMDAKRDWGFSGDYVRAMWMMLQQANPDDYVVATGETRSVRDLCEYVFRRLGMNYLDHLKQDAKFLRPEELPYLKGDASKARRVLGWKPEFTFEQVLDQMIEHWEGLILNGTNLLARRA